MRLTNLSLKREACYSLGLPLDVLSGYVQSIELSIPWSRLGSEPVMLNLDGVYLVVGPRTQQGIDEHGQHTWSWARKRARIEREWRGAQLRREALGADAPDGEPATHSTRDSLTLVRKIVNNVQLSLTNLHVRYEDATLSSAPFAAGVTLAGLSAFTTDQSGNRLFSVDPSVQFKRLELKALAVYHHCACDKMLDPSIPMHEMAEWLRSLIPTESAANGAHLVIDPVSAAVRACLRSDTLALQQRAPRTATELSLSAVSVSLSEPQLRDGVRAFEYFLAEAECADDGCGESAAPARPLGSVVQAPRAWWRYAVLRVVRESRRACGWRLHAGFFEERRAMRLRYIELYKRSQARGKPLSESELTELQQLEHSALSVEDVVHFRSRAQLQLHAEGGGHERGDGAARDERAQTWWGWVTGAEVAEVPKAVDVGGEIALTPEQRAMLSALLAPPEESAAAAAAGDAEAEYVEHELKVSLDAVSIALVEHHSAAVVSAGDVAPEHQEIAQMAVRRLHVCIAKRCAGLRGEGSLGTLELVDCAAAEGMLGRELIRPASTLRSSDPGVACEPQWRFRLVQSPPGRCEDYELSLTCAAPLEIVHNAPLLQR